MLMFFLISYYTGNLPKHICIYDHFTYNLQLQCHYVYDILCIKHSFCFDFGLWLLTYNLGTCHEIRLLWWILSHLLSDQLVCMRCCSGRHILRTYLPGNALLLDYSLYVDVVAYLCSRSANALQVFRSSECCTSMHRCQVTEIISLGGVGPVGVGCESRTCCLLCLAICFHAPFFWKGSWIV